MKNDILDDLYYGRIIPWEQGPSNLDAQKKSEARVNDLIEQLKVLLDEKGRSILNQLVDEQINSSLNAASDSFKSGFRLGAKLMKAMLEEPQQSEDKVL